MGDETSTAQQEARKKLRELFLNAMNELNGRQCNILTYEKTMLQATLAGWKPDGRELLVHNLNTPAGICVESALLRTPDLLSIKFEEPVLLP